MLLAKAGTKVHKVFQKPHMHTQTGSTERSTDLPFKFSSSPVWGCEGWGRVWSTSSPINPRVSKPYPFGCTTLCSDANGIIFIACIARKIGKRENSSKNGENSPSFRCCSSEVDHPNVFSQNITKSKKTLVRSALVGYVTFVSIFSCQTISLVPLILNGFHHFAAPEIELGGSAELSVDQLLKVMFGELNLAPLQVGCTARFMLPPTTPLFGPWPRRVTESH